MKLKNKLSGFSPHANYLPTNDDDNNNNSIIIK
jgi:hypothetical protein